MIESKRTRHKSSQPFEQKKIWKCSIEKLQNILEQYNTTLVRIAFVYDEFVLKLYISDSCKVYIYIESSLVDSGFSPSNLFGVNDVMDFVTIFLLIRVQ